ncbi:MAG: hypothetical protein WC455_23120 [Dehalococcoidia bacterium]|jgi:hypothetical protein
MSKIEIALYIIAGVFIGSFLATAFICLVFRATEPKRDVTAEILEGLREPTWKVPVETKKDSSHE